MRDFFAVTQPHGEALKVVDASLSAEMRLRRTSDFRRIEMPPYASGFLVEAYVKDMESLKKETYFTYMLFGACLIHAKALGRVLGRTKVPDYGGR